MHLTETQSERYHQTVLSLFHYVDVHEAITAEDPGDDPHLAVVRTTLIARVAWRRPDLIEAFVDENPDRLPQDCLDIALGWRNPLFDEMISMGVQDGRMVFLHPTGLYAALETTAGIADQTPKETLWVRTALLPFEDVIIAAPPLQVTGTASPAEIERMRTSIGLSAADAPIKDAQEFCRRVRAWKKDESRDVAPKPTDPVAPGPLPHGYHRGALAGLSEKERTEAKDQWLATPEARKRCGRQLRKAIGQKIDHLPTTLKEAIIMTEPQRALAIAFAMTDNMPQLNSYNRKATIAAVASKLAERLPHEREMHELVLSCAHSAQLATIRKLLDTNPLDITGLSLEELRWYVAFEPYSFVFRNKGRIVAWMPPELVDVLRTIDFDKVEVGRTKMQEAALAASMMVTRCGVATLDDLHERYSRIVMDPADRATLEHALSLYELYGNANYSLTPLVDSVLLVHPLIENDPASIAQLLMYHQVVEAPPLEPSVLTCEKGSLEWYCHQPRAVELRNFVDERIPDGMDDYSHADTMVLDAVISIMHDRVDYSTYMDLMRRYRMEGCEGMHTSHAVGRLLTNLYNAMPQWERNGWSAESDFERATGKRRLYNPDGTQYGTEPIAPAA